MFGSGMIKSKSRIGGLVSDKQILCAYTGQRSYIVLARGQQIILLCNMLVIASPISD